MTNQPWHKSTYSDGAHNCVEISEGGVTRLRDSQHRELGHLEAEPSEWSAFLRVVASV